MHKNQWCINYVTDESLRTISDPKYKKPQILIWGLWGLDFGLDRENGVLVDS